MHIIYIATFILAIIYSYYSETIKISYYDHMHKEQEKFSRSDISSHS